jgi:arylsulfatase A-like enzyme
MKTTLLLLLGLCGPFAFAMLAQEPPSTPAATTPTPPNKGKAGHVLVIAWDGLRPDLVTEQNTPNLFKLSRAGVTFDHQHAVYPTTTEVNGTALATGVYPEHSGIIANREYRPAINSREAVATEKLETIRLGDQVSGGRYVAVPTVAELVQAAGFPTAVAGTKPVALLQDRAETRTSAAAKNSVDVFSGAANPPEALPDIVAAAGKFPEMVSFPNAAEDAWTAKVLTGALWKDGVPKFSLLWLSDPDYSQHNTAPGSPVGLEALKSCDDRLATALAALEAKGVLAQTDVFIVSDHGFSTIDDAVDVAKVLADAGFPAVRQFADVPQRGQILVVSLGGSIGFYVVDPRPRAGNLWPRSGLYRHAGRARYHARLPVERPQEPVRRAGGGRLGCRQAGRPGHARLAQSL